MTTSVRIHVNGAYRARVVQKDVAGNITADVVVEGNYEGSPNPSGEHHFTAYHPAAFSFEVTEEQVVLPAADHHEDLGHTKLHK